MKLTEEYKKIILDSLLNCEDSEDFIKKINEIIISNNPKIAIEIANFIQKNTSNTMKYNKKFIFKNLTVFAIKMYNNEKTMNNAFNIINNILKFAIKEDNIEVIDNLLVFVIETKNNKLINNTLNSFIEKSQIDIINKIFKNQPELLNFVNFDQPTNRILINGRLNNIKLETIIENFNNEEKKYILYSACRNGNLELVRYLIEQQYLNKEITGKLGQTPLHIACSNGNLNIVKYLCEKQNVNKELKENSFGKTPLHCACENGHLDVIKYLCEEQHVNKEARENFGETPFHYACENGHLDVIKYLCEEQNVNKEARDESNATPLHSACLSRNTEVVKYLYEEQHVNKEVKDKSGKTPFHYACENGHLDVIKYLCEEQNINGEDIKKAIEIEDKKIYKNKIMINFLANILNQKEQIKTKEIELNHLTDIEQTLEKTITVKNEESFDSPSVL